MVDGQKLSLRPSTCSRCTVGEDIKVVPFLVQTSSDNSYKMYFTATLVAPVLFFSALVSFTSGNVIRETASKSDCRFLPGDKDWPSSQEWRKLNDTVKGRLIATIPLGSPCHDPNYDAAKCSALQNIWDLPRVQ